MTDAVLRGSDLTGNRIRDQRRDRGPGQAEPEGEVGSSAWYLHLIEHDRRRIAGKRLHDIARAPGVEAQSLSEGGEAVLIGHLRSRVAETAARPEPSLWGCSAPRAVLAGP